LKMNGNTTESSSKKLKTEIVTQRSQPEDIRSKNCPYLDTIDRSVLDFDFEKLCSVSLSHLNCYACLVCGKYFQGRGQKSYAYTHSVQDSHHVFLNLETKKFYCLPDNYQILDQSLEDITFMLNPAYKVEHIENLDVSSKLVRAYDGSMYLPGVVGINNIKANDYCNVILQALSHVGPLRNFFLREENYVSHRSAGDKLHLLVTRFGELLRKLWNPRHFKAHVSPHEMLQAVVLASEKKFQITKQGDCVDFISWFLNALQRSLASKKKSSSTVVGKTFRGSMRVWSRKIPAADIKEEERKKLLEEEEFQEKVVDMPFLYLTCDLPAPPLFPDDQRENIIPQVPIYQLLNKFNGLQEKEYKTYKDSTFRRFILTKLPPFIILYFKRFTKNTFILEKNNTIVNFPVKGIDFGELLAPEVRSKHKHTVYDLVANIVHEGEPSNKGSANKGTYKAHILHKGSGKWFELQDLHVSDILPQMITLSESYLQIYEVNKSIVSAPPTSPEEASNTIGPILPQAQR